MSEKERLWTVARFPNGHWTTGGHPDDAEYNECETWRVFAAGRDDAKKKAQALRAREQRKLRGQAKKHSALS